MWDISRSRLLHTLTGHTAAVFAIDMSDTGAVVITGSADRVGWVTKSIATASRLTFQSYDVQHFHET